MPVDRLRYFTGLFLEEPDFTTEQLYHMQMRRRINYGLLTQGILFGLEVVRVATDQVRVDPGMAVDRDDVNFQAREMVLTAARTVSLSAFAVGSQVYITASYQEKPTQPKPPQNIEARTTEDPVIGTQLDTGAGFTGNANTTIILAKVSVGDLSLPNFTERKVSQIRLGGGASSGPGAPTVASLTFSAATSQGSNPVMTISGTNLGNTPNVTVLDATSNPDATITAAINAGASSNTSLVVNLTIGGAAPVGPRLVRVQTAGGTVTTTSAGPTAFVVVAPVATITVINPTSGRQTVAVNVTITGTNLTGATVSLLLNNGTVDASTVVSAVVVAAGGNSLTATFTIGAGAVPGGRIVQVTTGSGTVASAQNFFTVVAAPVIQNISPVLGPAGTQVVVRGTNIRNPAIVVGQPATGTTVRFEDPGNSANNVAATAVTAFADFAVGVQQVQATVPLRGALPATVNLSLTIDGVRVVAPQTYQFF